MDLNKEIASLNERVAALEEKVSSKLISVQEFEQVPEPAETTAEPETEPAFTEEAKPYRSHRRSRSSK